MGLSANLGQKFFSVIKLQSAVEADLVNLLCSFVTSANTTGQIERPLGHVCIDRRAHEIYLV